MNTSEFNFTISPNPATSEVNLFLNFNCMSCDVVLLNETGYVFFKTSISSDQIGEKITLDVSHTPPGKYLLSILNKEQYSTPKKIILF